MKKATAILFLFIFLISNSGMAVSVHYCGGKIKAVKFLFGDKHPCNCGKKPMKPGCCKDKTTILKANDELAKVNSIALKCPLVEFTGIIPAQIVVMPSAHLKYSISPFYHPPPCKPKIPIYLLDRVFLI